MTLGRVARLTVVLVGLSSLLVGAEVGAGLDDGAGGGKSPPLPSRNPGAAKPVMQKATRTITAIKIPMAIPGFTVAGCAGGFCCSG
ncbi:hypothetical protein C791_6298 [Amycolatopsis azurea DSM 43854]|uniref:Secreted protein n=1 Tax=Amycolatopsis azurea DSM 43854 TaxID=1238180 RepID=M2PX64_9PSEU|nr:hypothetical protein C791_6298 [Amycolatopsis azurea DSM 43854]